MSGNDDEHGRRVTTADVESAKWKPSKRAAGEVQFNVVQVDDRWDHRKVEKASVPREPTPRLVSGRSPCGDAVGTALPDTGLKRHAAPGRPAPGGPGRGFLAVPHRRGLLFAFAS